MVTKDIKKLPIFLYPFLIERDLNIISRIMVVLFRDISVKDQVMKYYVLTYYISYIQLKKITVLYKLLKELNEEIN